MSEEHPPRPNRGQALIAAATEAALEAVKEIPFVGSVIESVRAYREHIEEEQRQRFIEKLEARLKIIEQGKDWYATDAGQEFVKKVVSTALNAEYADKTAFLADALVNGPSLGADQAKRLKFVEMLRQLSRPSLDVLIASQSEAYRNPRRQIEPGGTINVFDPEISTVYPGVDAGHLAVILEWDPNLVMSCVAELTASGAFSSVLEWHKSGSRFQPQQFMSNNQPSVTTLTEEFVRFISRPVSPQQRTPSNRKR